VEKTLARTPSQKVNMSRIQRSWLHRTLATTLTLSVRSRVRRLRVVGIALVLAVCSFGALIGYAGDATSISASFAPSPVDVDATTTCTVTVHNDATAPNNGTPQGSVAVTKTAGDGTITGTCGTLNGSGQCTFNYTPSAGGTHSFSLVYTPSSGDWNASSGSKSVTATRLATYTTLELEMSSAFINQEVECTVHVVDAATGIPVTGDVDDVYPRTGRSGHDDAHRGVPGVREVRDELRGPSPHSKAAHHGSHDRLAQRGRQSRRSLRR